MMRDTTTYLNTEGVMSSAPSATSLFPALAPMPQVVLIVHRVGDDGPFWADCHAVEEDGTLGLIVHSGAFAATRTGAIEAAREGLTCRFHLASIEP